MKTSEQKEEHRDYQRFDHIEIRTNVRWKDSHLSGSEYRFGAQALGYKNGYLVFQRSFMDVATAAAHLPSIIYGDHIDNELIGTGWDEPVCQQEGCSNVGTHVRYLKKRYVGNEAIEDTRERGRLYRIFCDRHEGRGDCAIDDAEHNYETRIDVAFELTTPQSITYGHNSQWAA